MKDPVIESLRRSCNDALHPVGMSTHSGKVTVPVDHVLRLIRMVESLEERSAALTSFKDNLREIADLSPSGISSKAMLTWIEELESRIK